MRLRNVRLDRYNRYIKMAYSVARGLAKKFHRPYQEVADEAAAHLAVIVCERWDEFDETKSKETTWVYHGIYWHLTRCYFTADSPARHSEMKYTSFPEDWDSTAPSQSWIEQTLSEMGEEGRALLFIVLEASGSFAKEILCIRELFKRRRETQSIELRRAIHRKLSEDGWQPDRVAKAFSELEEVLT